MFSDTTIAVMLTVAALLFLGLGWPIGQEVRRVVVRRLLRRRIRQEHLAWVERRKQYAREVLR